MNRCMKSLSVTLMVLFGLASQSAHALVFNLGSTGNADADSGFALAAAYLSGRFEDDIEINVTTGYTSLGGSILGQASSAQGSISFTGWKDAMTADVSTLDDATMVGSLPAGASFDMLINYTADNPNGSGSASAYLDDDDGANNSLVRITSANAKALGLLSGSNAAADAEITFSSDYIWDFDPSDGISGGGIDFVGVAIHELMHAMGFISGVDVLDLNSSGTFHQDDAFTFVSGLDFTRYSSASYALGAIDWTAGAGSKYFSIDGGATNLTPGSAGGWSTGVAHGDGRQASHWKDNQGIGLMDPTSAPAGSANVVSGLDLLALDVIGWDPVSSNAIAAPGSLLLLIGGLLGLSARRRRGDDWSCTAPASD